jgi:hypothetical protein
MKSKTVVEIAAAVAVLLLLSVGRSGGPLADHLIGIGVLLVLMGTLVRQTIRRRSVGPSVEAGRHIDHGSQ